MDDVVARILLRIESTGLENVALTEAQLKGLGNAAETTGAKMNAGLESSRAHAGLGLLSTAMLAAGAAIGIADVASIKWAADFEDSLAKVRGNTGMTTAEIAQFREEVLKLAAAGPASLDDIAMAFERVKNEGFSVAESTQIVHAAWEAAIATGSKVADVANSLAVVMHNFHEPASAAAADIGILMAIAAQGNMRLGDLTENFSKLGVTAAAIHMPLADVGALFSALTRATGDAALAQTQLVGALIHIINPTKQAQTVMAELSKTTGVDLVSDFQKLSVGAISVTKVMEDARTATKGNAQEIMALFGGIRGGLAMLTLLGDGWKSYLDITKRTHDANQLVETEFANMSKTVGFQMGALAHNVQELGIAIGDVAIPPLEAVIKFLDPLAMDLTNVAKTAPAVTGGITLAGAAFLGLGVAIKATTALASPYATAIGAVQKALAGTAAGTEAAAAGEAATGEAAAAATPEIVGYDAALGALTAEASGLIVPLSAIPAEVEATGVAAADATDAVGAGGLAGAFGLLMNPEIAIPAAVIAGGIFAYETMPAVKNAANEAARSIGTDLTGALFVAEDAFNTVRTTMGQQTVDTKSASTAASDLAGSWLKLSTNLGDMIPGFRSVHDAADFLNQAMAQEVKQHDAAAAAAKRHADAIAGLKAGMEMDATRGHGGLDAGVTAAGTPPAVSEAGAATDFLKVLKDATNANNEAMAAFADGLQFGSRNLGQLSSAAAATTQAVDQLKQKQVEAGAAVDLILGHADAGIQNFVNSLQSQATTSIELFALGMQRGAHNLAQLEAAAIAAGKANQQYSKDLAEATKIVDHALGIPDPAAQRLAAALNKAAKAGEDYASHITQHAAQAAANLAQGINQGDSPEKIKILTAIAAAAAREVQGLGKSSVDAAARIAKSTGDWASVLSATQKALQDDVNKTVGKYVADRAAGNVAALPADRAAVNEAENRLKALNKEISNLEGAAKTLSTSFQDLADKANAALTAAMDHLEKGLLDSGGKMTPAVQRLAETADRAQIAVNHYAAIHDQAAAIVLRATAAIGTVAQRFDALSNDLSTKAKSALDAFVLGLRAHDTPTQLRELGDAAQRAAAAAAKFAEIQLRAAERVGTPSQRLSAREQDEQGKLSNAEAKITLAIEDHKKVTREDIAAAQEHERAVQRDTQAQWDAAFAAASVSERHAMLAQQASGLISRFQTLQSATQSVIDAQMTVAQDKIAILKDRLDAMSKAYEDATAIFQARNASIKDQGTAGVTAVTDTSGILKAQSDILSAILQVGLSSKAESAATAVQAIQVANDQLAVARDQQTIDEAAAVAQQKIDADNVKIAEDRAHVDDLQGRMTIDVAYQQLQLDHDKITLAKDQLKLTELTNQGISLIASHFGETKSYDDKIRGVLSKIDADSIQIDADQKGALSVTTGWLQIIAAATKQMDQDTRQLATDQGASDSGTAEGQRKIAIDQQLVQADQTYLQDLQAVDQATQSVTDAFNQLASDQSKMVVDSYNAMVTAVNDATSVLQAISGVSKASEDGQIKAVQDQSAIIKAEGDIASAKSSQQLAVARDELTIAEDTLTMDQTNARWAIRLATDQVKLAEDKSAADAVKAAWDHTIDLDIIKVDQDKVKLAEDQLLLTEENLSLQAQVVDLLGGDSSGAMGQMPDILKQISGDQSAIATDQAAQQRDQQLAAQQEAAMALQTAYDQQQMARDQAAADAASAAGQMRLAQDGNRLAADQVAEQMQTNSILSMSRADMQQWNAGFLDAIRNLRSGVDYHWVGSGPNPFETFINSAPASFSMNPSP